MRYFGVLFLVLCLSSCHYFDKEKVNVEDLLNEELKMVDWNAVDQYPSFSICDSTSTKIDRRLCFENTLTSHINSNLKDATIIVSETISDTIFMTFQISEKGKLTVNKIETNTITKTQISDIDSLLVNSLKNMPTIYPAIKRGQQVKTEFKLPIIIKN